MLTALHTVDQLQAVAYITATEPALTLVAQLSLVGGSGVLAAPVCLRPCCSLDLAPTRAEDLLTLDLLDMLTVDDLCWCRRYAKESVKNAPLGLHNGAPLAPCCIGHGKSLPPVPSPTPPLSASGPRLPLCLHWHLHQPRQQPQCCYEKKRCRHCLNSSLH